MSFLAPGFLVAAAIAAAGVIALHMIVTRRPRAVAFPTARFIPDIPVSARSRAVRMSDLLLLLVRVLAIVMAGAALARPVFPPHREPVARVIVADVSGSVASVGETRDSARKLFRGGDALVLFDTAAWTVRDTDSIPTLGRTRRPGSLSAAMVAAMHAASRLRDGADSIELVLVSPIAVGERDRATALIRAQWPGRARLVHVSSAAAVAGETPALNASDVAFLGNSRPRFAVARTRIDTVGAVVARTSVLVARFERRWSFVPDSLVGAQVIARWADGEPAAIARDSASGCLRSIAIPIDSSGDMLLRPSFTRLRAVLAASCVDAASAPDPRTAEMLAGTGSLAATAQLAPPPSRDAPAARWLAVIALGLVIGEMMLRRSRATGGDT